MSKYTTLASFYNLIVNKLTKGHERSVVAKKNILATIFIKGLSIAISLVFVPLAINYVNPSQYGIWLTLMSIVGWFSFFDIGLTQGLRNKFAEAMAKGDDNLAQTYVSTTYVLLGLIFSGVWIIFMITNFFLDWSKILNVSDSLRSDVSILAIIIFTYFCLDFVLRIITTLITANQEPAKSSLIDVLGQLVSLIFIIILIKCTQGSLLKLGIALCISPILVLIAANFFFFRGQLKKYRPIRSKVDFSCAKGLISLGVVFFIIQIASIIQYQTSNIIIARNLGTSDVTSFNIVYKYFGVLLMINSIFLNPFWSASTEAYVKKDIQWIKNAIRKYNYLNLFLIILGLIMLLASSTIYDLWLGKGKVNIPFILSFWGFIYFNVMIFGSKYVHFLNGINALKIQFWSSVISPIVFIIIALIFIKYFKYGASAMFIASIVSNSNGLILAPIQYHQIINKNKGGAWRK
jgi:O-antigen/teichoic acid export membrane protein